MFHSVHNPSPWAIWYTRKQLSGPVGSDSPVLWDKIEHQSHTLVQESLTMTLENLQGPATSSTAIMEIMDRLRKCSQTSKAR